MASPAGGPAGEIIPRSRRNASTSKFERQQEGSFALAVILAEPAERCGMTQAKSALRQRPAPARAKEKPGCGGKKNALKASPTPKTTTGRNFHQRRLADRPERPTRISKAEEDQKKASGQPSAG